jgi:hypothetical protein
VILAICLMLSACGGKQKPQPTLVNVTGLVTLNGKPLPNATVIFLPQGPGEISGGRTNETGEFSLKHSQNEAGAVPGTYRVEIRTGGEVLDSDGRIVSESREILPVRYHSESTLTAEVPASGAKLDFALKSK